MRYQDSTCVLSDIDLIRRICRRAGDTRASKLSDLAFMRAFPTNTNTSCARTKITGPTIRKVGAVHFANSSVAEVLAHGLPQPPILISPKLRIINCPKPHNPRKSWQNSLQSITPYHSPALLIGIAWHQQGKTESSWLSGSQSQAPAQSDGGSLSTVGGPMPAASLLRQGSQISRFGAPKR